MSPDSRSTIFHHCDEMQSPDSCLTHFHQFCGYLHRFSVLLWSVSSWCFTVLCLQDFLVMIVTWYVSETSWLLFEVWSFLLGLLIFFRSFVIVIMIPCLCLKPFHCYVMLLNVVCNWINIIMIPDLCQALAFFGMFVIILNRAMVHTGSIMMMMTAWIVTRCVQRN